MKLSTTFIRVLTVVVITVMLFTFSVRANTFTAQAQSHSTINFSACSLPALALKFVGTLLETQQHQAVLNLPFAAFRNLSKFQFPWTKNSKTPLLPFLAKPRTTVMLPWRNVLGAAYATLHSCQRVTLA